MKQPGSILDRRHASLRSTFPTPPKGNQNDDSSDDGHGRNFEFAEALTRARSN